MLTVATQIMAVPMPIEACVAPFDDALKLALISFLIALGFLALLLALFWAYWVFGLKRTAAKAAWFSRSYGIVLAAIAAALTGIVLALPVTQFIKHQLC